MAVRSLYVCSNCNKTEIRPMGRCPGCGEFNTFVQQVDQAASSSKVSAAKRIARGGPSHAAPAKVKKLSEHTASDHDRISTGNAEFDRVLGGGIVPGACMLLAALPGAGKSTLSNQVCDHLASTGMQILYVAGEESGEQIKLRANRLGLKHADRIDLTTDTAVGAICAAIPNYDFVIIDSIQTVHDPDATGRAGSTSVVSTVTEAIRAVVKENAVPTLMIGHFTKSGEVAGPQHLSHMVDVVMEMTGERTDTFRLLRAEKNRFGSTAELGVMEMTSQGLREVTDPTAMFLADIDGDAQVPGSIICPVIEGSRPMLVEVQALVAPTNLQMPVRRVQGIDRARLDMLLAVLGERAGVRKLGGKDVYVKISGGVKIEEPALDLAICLAVASAATKRCVKANVAAFGEVSLKGDIRPVTQAERRVTEASRQGFDKVLGPGRQTPIAVKSVRAAVDAALEAEQTIVALDDDGE